jgi:hypothetical protein
VGGSSSGSSPTLRSRLRNTGARTDALVDSGHTVVAPAVRDGVIAFVAADNLFDARIEVSETGDRVEGYGPPRILRAGLSLRW